MTKLMLTLIYILTIAGCDKKDEFYSKNKINYDYKKTKETAKEIVAISEMVLKTELTNAMARGGIKEAVIYCNLNALKITDSLSKIHGVEIKRLSTKNRNPNNLLDLKTDLKYVNNNGIGSHEEYIANEDGVLNSLTTYIPIKTKPMCLSCHGDIKNNIGEENYKLIKSIYPNDKATGYKEGDLRGFWSIKKQHYKKN